MMRRPGTCCQVGTYDCQVHMPIAGRVQGVDLCIADIVAALNAANITTVASCCGHGTMPGIVSLADGRELSVLTAEPEGKEPCPVCDGTRRLHDIGVHDDSTDANCPRCNGTGALPAEGKEQK